MESKLNNTTKNINNILRVNIQKEETNITTTNSQFKTIYMYIPNKIK